MKCRTNLCPPGFCKCEEISKADCGCVFSTTGVQIAICNGCAELLSHSNPDAFRTFNIKNYDSEIAAIKIVLETLADFTQPEQERILNYAQSWYRDGMKKK